MCPAEKRRSEGREQGQREAWHARSSPSSVRLPAQATAAPSRILEGESALLSLSPLSLSLSATAAVAAAAPSVQTK